MTYHYVRPLAGSAYPNIRGLELASFERQLDYFSRHYQPVTMEQVVDAIDGQDQLPSNSVLLTFDDGYLEHFTHVARILGQRSIKGAFFPPVRAVRDREVLAVNKLHFVLATCADPVALVADLDRACTSCAAEHDLPSLADLRAAHWRVRAYETIEVSYVKNLLQKVLPKAVREELVEGWFARYVSADPRGFADELYVTKDQLGFMVADGHHIGAHGVGHYRFDTLSPEQQEAEVAGSLQLLADVGASSAYRTMCYPYGAYNADTVSILERWSFRAALTTQPGLTDLSPGGRFSLARLDTNEFPVQADAAPCEWTVAVTH